MQLSYDDNAESAAKSELAMESDPTYEENISCTCSSGESTQALYRPYMRVAQWHIVQLHVALLILHTAFDRQEHIQCLSQPES